MSCYLLTNQLAPENAPSSPFVGLSVACCKLTLLWLKA